MTRNIVQCSRCGTQLDLSAFATGQTVACQCGTQLIVPPPEAEGAQQPSGPPQAPPQAPPHVGPQPSGPAPGPHPSQVHPQYVQATSQCRQATHALVFGILGVVIACLGLIFGPIAISKAKEADKMIKANPRLEGSGMALAGRVLGIIATILGVIALIQFIAVVAGMGCMLQGGDW